MLARSGDEPPRAGARSDTCSLLAAAETAAEMAELSARVGPPGHGQGPPGPGQEEGQAGSWQRSLSSRVARALPVGDGWARLFSKMKLRRARPVSCVISIRAGFLRLARCCPMLYVPCSSSCTPICRLYARYRMRPGLTREVPWFTKDTIREDNAH